MISTITRLLMVSRPISWVNTAYPFAAGYIMTGGNNLRLFTVGSIFFLLPYNLVRYGINDVLEYESDSKIPREGGMEGMREQRAFHPIVVEASILATLPFVVWLGLVGSLVNLIVLRGLIFFVIAYSVKGLRIKEV